MIAQFVKDSLFLPGWGVMENDTKYRGRGFYRRGGTIGPPGFGPRLRRGAPGPRRSVVRRAAGAMSAGAG
jgi:hypothetical protein